MAVLIGHASIDENNKARGGKAGDQTGKEVCIRNYYKYPGGWDFILRPISAIQAQKEVQACIDACNNPNIGYDQNERLSLNKQAEKVGHDIKKITTPCECDCSSLQCECSIAAGVNVSASLRTATMLRGFKLTEEYIVIHAPEYYGTDKCLRAGDILVKAGHHTVKVLSDGTHADRCPFPAPSIVIRKGTKGTNAGYIQHYLNQFVQAGILKGKPVEIDKDWGDDTSRLFEEFQRKFPETGTNGKPDGACGSKCRAKFAQYFK